MAVLKHLTNQMQGGGTGGGGGVMWYPTKDISIESLVIGKKFIQDVEMEDTLRSTILLFTLFFLTLKIWKRILIGMLLIFRCARGGVLGD